MFNQTPVFDGDISAWDVRQVSDMDFMFSLAEAFDQDISGWQTESLVDMRGMFSSAFQFNQDLNGWDVSRVADMGFLFNRATRFNGNVNGWNVGNVTDMSRMFNDSAFNQDLSSWDVGMVNNMSEMFAGTPIDQDFSSWEVVQVTNASGMFRGATLSVANYDALLIGWNARNLMPNVNFNGGNSQYCEGEAARQNMIDTDLWNISDRGLVGPTVDDLADQTQLNSYTLPTISGLQLTGGQAYYTATNGGGTQYNEGDIINFADFPTYPITLYIFDGSGSCASEETFLLTLTSDGGTVPSTCTTLTNPVTLTDVPVSLNTLTWDPVSDATGYRISINATISTVNNITDLNVTATSYTLPGNFDNGETVSVTIIPFNTTGDAVGCDTPQTFTIIAEAPTVPASCASLTMPTTTTDVVINIGTISWDAVADATGYRVTINGSTSDVNDITDQDITGTSFTLPGNFDNGETVSVTIIPFNTTGNCLLYTSPSPRDQRGSRMPSSA